MADPVPAKKTRKSSGPRQARPVFGIVTYTDEGGAPVQLDKSRLNIQIERDSGKIVDLLTGGSGDYSNAAVVRIEMPAPNTRKPAEATA